MGIVSNLFCIRNVAINNNAINRTCFGIWLFFSFSIRYSEELCMKDNYWQKLVDKHLVGRKIVKVKWLDPKETDKIFGWSQQPCEIHLDNGTVLTPSMDDEGNDAGAIFTNITELSVIPTFRE